MMSVYKIIRVKPSAKIALELNGVSFNTTASQIRGGVGSEYKINSAAQKALDALEFMRSGIGAASKAACGLTGQWEGVNVCLNLIK